MLLTRITPDGEERWTATLPLKIAQRIGVSDHHVAFSGLPPGTDLSRQLRLVTVSLGDGRFHEFAFNGR